MKNGFGYQDILMMSLPEVNSYLEILAPSRPGQQRIVSKRKPKGRNRGA